MNENRRQDRGRDGTSSGRSRQNRNESSRNQPDRSGAGRNQPARQQSTRKPTTRARISPARLVAYDVLRDVEDRDAYANLALPARIRDARLDGRDAALATELVAGTLRGRGRYDRIIELASQRDIDAIDSRTRNVLRLGAHQLLSMRTAAHAAVNESVELQRRVANEKAAGFVNGVLRSIERSTPEQWDERIEAESKTRDEALAIRTSHPAWVMRALRDALRAEGREHELESLLAADNFSPRVSLAVLPGAGLDDETAEALSIDLSTGEAALTASGPSPLGFEVTGGDPARAIGALDVPPGFARVQDQGSQLAALALTRHGRSSAGERWLDLCAGPGGKTAVLGAEAQLVGATVRANEVSEHRARLVENSVEASVDSVTVVSFDGRDPEAFGDSLHEESAGYDRILVDAPCSGLGALRRRPEARWRKQPGDLPELTRLQRELLESAVQHLAPGGVLAYVTCSPHLAETRVVLDTVLRAHPELRELDAKAAVNSVAREPLDLAGETLSAQLWPHRHGTDAMFISLLGRTAN